MDAKPVKKRDITRAKVIQAAIDCIYEVGFNAAHTNRIADAAGVSWGVLQYHFGDKDGLLEAVLHHIFDEFSSTLASTAVTGDDLQQRIEHLIEVVWSLVSRKEYRVSLAILRNAGKDASSTIDGQQQIERWAQRINQLWDQLVTRDIATPAKSEVALHLLFATLRGMADEINPSGRTPRALKAERKALARSTVYLLTS